MYKGRKVAIVIPAFNVATHIGDVIAGIPPLADVIVIVDDASVDETRKLIGASTDSRVTLVSHTRNLGVGGAMISGFRVALQNSAELIVKMDGDGQMEPSYLPALLEPLVSEGYGYAKGNRFLCNEQLSQMPRLRMLGSFCLTFVTKLVSGYWHVFDPVNGYFAIATDVLRKLPLERLARRYFFETDMLIHLNVFAIRVKDVPIPPRYRTERSAMRLKTVALTFPMFLLKGFWYRLYNRHILREFSAVAVFWTLGIILLVWGTGFGTYTWLKSIHSGHVATTGTVMLSVLPFFIGFELALQAILIEINDSPR